MDNKSPDAFRTISEVAEDLDIPQHVLRFWETRFSQIKPLKRGGGRRYYRPDDVALLKGIRRLLYGEGYTIKGLQRILKEQGPRYVQAIGRGGEIVGSNAPTQPSAVAHMAPPPGEAMPAAQPAQHHQPAPAMEPGFAAKALLSSLPRAAQPLVGADDLAFLKATLSELIECRRLLHGALAGATVGEDG
ncbi:MerR family transcriptional regulator [Bosea sp. (in: a-proteobacteria)]|uniref:MerR family transcriptional regulator n=1 Tax=Bosea sp. (in: a-proteobacteria) TaxID=1871050 RepID=UPI002DDD3A8B|nr:MerR family transcriptional regulator [Bosea sp. (in: a-proteobacteria)]HEV2513069.1 MerR family transcriptional regulator [Bosea sp. (in: a-proteobacteria)]